MSNVSPQDNKATMSNHNTSMDRVVTDSVHSRFRSLEVYCEICDMGIAGNHSAIKKHYNKSHPSKEFCCYCKGKVFTYIQMPTDNSTEEPKKTIYHKCNKS
ncbi:uncharacterized protein LOC143425909 [Xylocopa sonorina]|uniref:uncharacterized protein LOC143425909 n=1 Tax=Xylocopa sonorina TaxID=1818115 RepID=UPI00403B27BD